MIQGFSVLGSSFTNLLFGYPIESINILILNAILFTLFCFQEGVIFILTKCWFYFLAEGNEPADRFNDVKLREWKNTNLRGCHPLFGLIESQFHPDTSSPRVKFLKF